MARVTVEDCVDKVPNRFDLVLLSAQRAREISGGAELTVDRDRDKNPVVALREIAEQTIKPKDLNESLVLNRGGRGRLAQPVGRGAADHGVGPRPLDLDRGGLRRLIARPAPRGPRSFLQSRNRPDGGS